MKSGAPARVRQRILTYFDGKYHCMADLLWDIRSLEQLITRRWDTESRRQDWTRLFVAMHNLNVYTMYLLFKYPDTQNRKLLAPISFYYKMMHSNIITLSLCVTHIHHTTFLHLLPLPVWPDWAIFESSWEQSPSKVAQIFSNNLGYCEKWHSFMLN